MFIYLFILNKTSWSQNLKVITNLQRKKNRKECLGDLKYLVFTLLIMQNHLCGVAVATDMATRKKMSTVATLSVVRSSAVSLRYVCKL